MTHDELLEDLNTWVRFLADKNKGKEWVKALLAVVELHKPSSILDWALTEEEYLCWCAHIYPCPTIKAIEKELE